MTPIVQQINWEQSDELGDGHYSTINQKGDFVLEHVATGHQRVVLDSTQAPSQGSSLNADKTLSLLPRNVTQGFRYSLTANYFIQDVKTKQIRPLIEEQNADVQFAIWNPK